MNRREVIDLLSELEDALVPATDEQVAIEIERLRANYAEWDSLPEPVLEMVIEDMLDDMSGYPLYLLVEACRRWRNSDAKRAPTAGQLKALVCVEHDRLCTTRFMAEKALELIAKEAA